MPGCLHLLTSRGNVGIRWLALKQELLFAIVVAKDDVSLKANHLDPIIRLAQMCIVLRLLGNHGGKWQVTRIARALHLLREGVQCTFAMACGRGIMWWKY